MFRRDVTVGVSNQDRRIVRSIGEDYDEQFDDLEALRLEALQSLHSRNCHIKASLSAAESGNTRHVSLGQEGDSDFKIITVERCNSFSSSSTDYEEIDLSTYSDNEENQDNDMFSDPENVESCSDAKDDIGSISSGWYMEEDEYEEVSSCSENVTPKDYINDVLNHEDFDHDEGGIDVEVEHGRAQCISEMSDDELLESDNKFSILNDISITIPNESLASNEEIQHSDVYEDNQLNLEVDTHELERNKEELCESQLQKKQVVSGQSVDEQENESVLENDSALSENADENKTESPVLGKIEKRDLITLSVSQTPDKGKVKTGFSNHQESNRQEAKQPAGKKDKPLQMATLKTNAKTLAEHNSNLSSSKKGKTQKNKQDSAATVKAQQHEKVNNDKGKLTGSSDRILKKAVSQEGYVKPKTESSHVEAQVKSEHRETDFDQLSIEDEDSEFEEGGKEEPAIKSKVGFNRTAIESLLAKRSHSVERRQGRYLVSPISRDSRFYHRHPGYRDRLSDYRFRSWSRERHRNRSPERTWRGVNSRLRLQSRRSHSRDRKQTHITGRDRDQVSYRRSRSRSRSRDHRTRNDTYSHFRREEKRKDNLREISSKAKESRNIKKESNSDTSLTRLRSKELKSQVSVDRKKTANIKHQLTKPSSEISVRNGSKVKVSSFASRNPDSKSNQAKDLRSRLEETTEKAVTREGTAAKKDQEKELDARIKRIKQHNHAILRRAKEIQADKMKYSCC